MIECMECGKKQTHRVCAACFASWTVEDARRTYNAIMGPLPAGQAEGGTLVSTEQPNFIEVLAARMNEGLAKQHPGTAPVVVERGLHNPWDAACAIVLDGAPVDPNAACPTCNAAGWDALNAIPGTV